MRCLRRLLLLLLPLLFALAVWLLFAFLHGRYIQKLEQELSVYPWLYLRNDQPPGSGEQTVEIIAVGDILLGRGIKNPSAAFSESRDWLRSADLTVGNLECALSSNPVSATMPISHTLTGVYILTAPPEAALALRQAGFDLLDLANNHSLDLGPSGLAETGQYLADRQIEWVGAGPTHEQAYQPFVSTLKGIRLAFVAFNAIPYPRQFVFQPGPETWTIAGWDRARLLAAIRSARLQADMVIVLAHWGYEYQTQVDPAQAEIAQAMMEAGADLVIGHHPHVVQPLQVYHTNTGDRVQVVAYSLGNFVFDQGFGDTDLGLALRIFVDRQGLRAVQALPVVASTQPRLQAHDQAGEWIDRLHALPQSLAFMCEPADCIPAQPVITDAAGRFVSGQVDLSGDGLPELVFLKDGQIIIQQDGQEAWRSPSEWEVVDLALGDSDQDGRQDILAAFWKPDAQGVLRSHPFILGYRGSIYRTVWGGSEVSDPILEVEIGDVDGDGKQELVVLEQQPEGGDKAVTVWRWHGWGFSLVWRSPSGRYERLVLAPPVNPGSILIQVLRSR